LNVKIVSDAKMVAGRLKVNIDLQIPEDELDLDEKKGGGKPGRGGAGRWVTIMGRHVFIGGDGVPRQGGPNGPKVDMDKLEGRGESKPKPEEKPKPKPEAEKPKIKPESEKPKPKSGEFPDEKELRKSPPVIKEEKEPSWKAGKDADVVEESLGVYSTAEFEIINTRLRDGDPVGPRLSKNVEAISDAISRSGPVEQPLYRGINLKESEQKELLAQIEKSKSAGEPIEMKGFTSTTVDPRQAAAFAGSPQFMFEIKAKRGVFMDGASAYPNEREVLLNHAEKYRVVSVQKKARYEGERRLPGGKIAKAKRPVTIVQLEMID
jgi:hypothetical protein